MYSVYTIDYLLASVHKPILNLLKNLYIFIGLKILPIYIPAQYFAIKAGCDENTVCSRVLYVLDPVAVSLKETHSPLKVTHVPKSNSVVVAA